MLFPLDGFVLAVGVNAKTEKAVIRRKSTSLMRKHAHASANQSEGSFVSRSIVNSYQRIVDAENLSYSRRTAEIHQVTVNHCTGGARSSPTGVALPVRGLKHGFQGAMRFKNL